MTRFLSSLGCLILAGGLAAPGLLRAASTNPAPDFQEVYDLLRANLPGATDASLNRAAIAGLLSQFPDKVVLDGASAGATGGHAEGANLDRASVIERNVAYFRVKRVSAGLADAIKAATRSLPATNKPAGAVLDLRFVGGDDYAAAQATAKLWSGPEATRPVSGPLVVLMNGQTRGAAEALAATLRQSDSALSIGSATAGAAMAFKEFSLKDGERLMIATAPLDVGGKPMPADGLKPDIAVSVPPDQERAFWESPYGPAPDALAANATNSFLPYVDHTSEADLVRQRQSDGHSLNTSPVLRPTRTSSRPGSGDSGTDSAATRPAPVLRDPVLARAVDLVKGLAALRATRT